MPSWSGDGGVTGYDPTVGPNVGVLHLASPGTVDAQGITRFQYSFNPKDHGYNSIVGTASLTFGPSDVSGHPGARLTASMYVIRDVFNGAVPTPSQIMAAAGVRVFRAPTYTTATGTYSFRVQGPWAEELNPNTKYWVLVIPTAVTDWASTPSPTNDKAITLPDTTGRAISLWTNRTPDKPTITSPSDGLVRASGDSFTLTVQPNDPDAIFGGTTKAYTDMSGIEVQYAPVATVDNPNPTWTGLTSTAMSGIDFYPSWFIDGSINTDINNGMYSFWTTLSMTVLCHAPTGSDTAPPKLLLPVGNWQIRVRTFDYGHPYPASALPLNSTDGNYSNTTFPSVNTSPWSDPIKVYVISSTPPPLAITPKNSTALVEGQPVTLQYQYRNANTPTLPQIHRKIQIRQVGATNWTTLVDEDSSSTTLVVTGFTLSATTAYEWRVQATSSDGTVSDWMTPAEFWIVPAANSGAVRPNPFSSIEGATLGCGKHRVFAYLRGGLKRAGEITQISHVDWGRVRDDKSTSKVVVSGWTEDCGNLLATLQTWAYEVVIFRDNGFSVDRVWEGPITTLKYESDKVTILSNDVMAYPYRRILKQDMNDLTSGGDTVVSRATRVLQNAMAPDDPNVLAYVQPIIRDDDAREYRDTVGWTRTAFEEIDDMASNAGLDYTAVGRSVLLWSGKHRIGTLPEFTDEYLGSSPVVTEYGMSMANLYSIGDGQGNHGDATRLDVSGNDPTYGLVEVIGSDWTSGSASNSGTYTQDQLTTAIAGWKASAEVAISDSYPPPVIVRVPDGTSLNPNTPVSIQQLIPGVVIPVRSTKTLRKVVGSQKLDSITVTEENGKETITVTMSPFSRDNVTISTGSDG